MSKGNGVAGNNDYLKGKGAQLNTHNPFLAQQYVQEHEEGIDEPWLEGKPSVQVLHENAKSLVNKVGSPDLPMAYSLNAYQGCEHGCIYCYARPTHEYWGYSAGLDFESKIIVKQNAPELLRRHFLKRGWQATPIAMSGNTDCYQPLEKKYGLTRQLLQTFLRFGNPVGLITKNQLVLRDLDVLQALAAERLVHVFVSLTTLDESLRRVMEPRTASGQNRLKVVRQLTEAGIPCGVVLAPTIPALNDHELPVLVEKAAEAGAQTIGYSVVRLNGTVAPLFEDWLHKNFPDRAGKVWHQIEALHGGEVNNTTFGRRMRGMGPYAQMIDQLYRTAKTKYFAGREMPAYALDKFRPNGTLSLF